MRTFLRILGKVFTFLLFLPTNPVFSRNKTYDTLYVYYYYSIIFVNKS